MPPLGLGQVVITKRNPNAIHLGLTATPRKLQEDKDAPEDDKEISASNLRYFGEPVYEYTLIQAQEDGYLAACEIVKRKPSIDNRIFTKEEILKAGVKDIRYFGFLANRRRARMLPLCRALFHQAPARETPLLVKPSLWTCPHCHGIMLSGCADNRRTTLLRRTQEGIPA